MTPPEVAGTAVAATEFTALAVRLDVRLENLHEKIDEMKKDQAADLDEIKAQVKQTNGRVTKLEIWQATLRGVQISTRWVPPVFAALAAALATKLVSG